METHFDVAMTETKDLVVNQGIEAQVLQVANMKTSDRGTDSEDDLLAEVKVPAKARNVLRKLDRFLLWKFFVLTVLCYLDR